MPITQTKNSAQEAINQYVSLNNNGNIYYGKISKVKNGGIIMNPYKGYRYDEEIGYPIWKLIDENSYVELSPNGYSVDPMGKKTIEFIINEQNEDIVRERTPTVIHIKDTSQIKVKGFQGSWMKSENLDKKQ